MSAVYEYYQDLASLHGLELPEVLLGEPVNVVEPEFRLPVQSVEPERVASRLATLESNSRDELSLATEFLRSVVAADHPQLGEPAPGKLPKSVITKLFSGLVPAGLVAGHISDFKLQAISQAEAPESVVDQFDKNARQAQRNELFYGTAHLLATAELHFGRTHQRVGRLARLAVTGTHDENHRLRALEPTAYLLSYKIPDSDWAVLDAMRRSRGRAWWAERKGKLNPVPSGTISKK